LLLVTVSCVNGVECTRTDLIESIIAKQIPKDKVNINNIDVFFFIG
jgi:hypothetical protein